MPFDWGLVQKVLIPGERREFFSAEKDIWKVARQIVKVVDMPKGSRPFRVYVDPADDGAEDVFRVGDRVRQWFYQRIGLADLLSVSSSASPKSSGW